MLKCLHCNVNVSNAHHQEKVNVTAFLMTSLLGLRILIMVNILPRTTSALLFHSKILTASLRWNKVFNYSLPQCIQGFF